MLHRLLVTAALVVVLLAARRTSAEQTASYPIPPLNSDFLVTHTPVLTPWQNGASAVVGSSSSVGASVGRVTFGPCVYRAAHHLRGRPLRHLPHGGRPVVRGGWQRGFRVNSPDGGRRPAGHQVAAGGLSL